MLRSELLLQLFIIILCASIVSLFAVKIYPSVLLSKRTASTQIPASITVAKKLGEADLPPTSIEISSLSLALPVSPGVIVDNTWMLYDDKVSWLATSKTPGRGNVILYAHNRKGLFGDLKQATIGARIVVKTNDKTYSYRIEQMSKVAPAAVDEVLSEKDQLTLYTCDGVFDQRRLIVVALPQN